MTTLLNNYPKVFLTLNGHWITACMHARAIQKLYLQHCTDPRKTVMYNGALHVLRDFAKEMAE